MKLAPRSVAVVAFLLYAIGPTPATAQSLGVREAALARMALAGSIAGDPVVLEALFAKNGVAESQDEIERRDRKWAEDELDALRAQLSGNPCAERLRELTQRDASIVEVILMDQRGANVCVSQPTTDYWQGDEAKFQKTFVEDRAAFVDQPAFDESSGTYSVQLSVLVKDGSGRKAGVLTLALKVHEQELAQR